MQRIDSTFIATAEKGEVSAILLRPPTASFMVVLGHGAGANMQHRHMASIARALHERNIASFRFNFPYMERGGKGRDSQATCLATVRSAVIAASHATIDVAPSMQILAGGHSFGGRMTSLAQAESPLPGVAGLVFFSFPLHPSGKPSSHRATHLSAIKIPMLFLSGSRDKLAQLDLFQSELAGLDHLATLHLLDTADHGFNILKRSRTQQEDVYCEASRTLQRWTRQLQEKQHAT